MGFRYTSPPLHQGLTSAALIAAGLAVMAAPGAAEAWAAWVIGTPEWVSVIAAVFALHMLVFWGMAAAFGYVDRHDRPAFIARHRIQSGKKRQPPLSRVARVLALNQLVLSPIMLGVLLGALHLRGWTPDPDLPGPVEVIVHLVLLGVIAAIWFYAAHRFLHRPWWMKRVHQVHHEFRTTNCIAAEYAHPVEMIFGNFFTLGLGVVILGPDLATIYLYTVVGTVTFVGHHSGYAIPWMSWAVHHDWHHYRYKEAFGTYGVLDRLLGTDKELRGLQDGQEVR